LIDLVKDLLYSLSWLWRVPESDVVIANSFWLPALLLHRKPISPAVFVSVERYPKGQLRLYKKAKRLRAPTQAVQSAILAQLPSFSNRTVVIPNPIDTEVFSPTVRNIHKSTKRILYTGRIHPEKGIHILINAFRIIAQERDDVELHITGEMRTERGGGGKTYGRKLERLARGFPVTFNPSIDSPRLLADALHSADYYCYPSLSENGESFGVAPLEAMSTGLAPIVSSLSCFSDFIEEGKTGYLFDHRAPDPEVTLANVLRSALNGSAKHIRMGLAAHKKSLEFSFESVADAFLAAFVR
jgi:glycosyltransferase involved in cell wall biosynthesis